MASIRKEVAIDATPEHVWSALRDVGELLARLVAGFVTDCRLDGDARVVTFANGMVARELIVDVDDAVGVDAGFGAFPARAIGLSMLTRLPSVSVNDT